MRCAEVDGGAEGVGGIVVGACAPAGHEFIAPTWAVIEVWDEAEEVIEPPRGAVAVWLW